MSATARLVNSFEYDMQTLPSQYVKMLADKIAVTTLASDVDLGAV